MHDRITSFADVDRLLESRSDATKRHHYSLEHMHELLAHLGHPEKQLKVIHVAGTSGKTSTAYYAAALLKQAGMRVGLTVSPHVDRVNERVQIGMKPLPELEFCRDFAKFWELLKHTRVIPNYFETFAAFAMWEFAARNVDYAVIEVGMGGLLDSTNVFDDPGKVCVITDIGYDHMQILGETLPEITAQKAGIIKLNNTVFCNRQGEEVMEVIRSTAAQKRADLHVLGSHGEPAGLEFLPLFQRRNFGLSLAAVRYVLERSELPTLGGEAVLEAAHTPIPARMQEIKLGDKTLILDIAHNEQKLRALMESVRAKYPGQPVATLLSVPTRESSLPKAIDSVKQMAKGSAHLILTALTADEKSPGLKKLLETCRDAGYESFETVPNPKEAFEALRARPEPLLVATGSTYLLNRIRPLLLSNR
jgi:dihydrofolate synthase/folylpolyglutamate synthase